MDKKEVLKNCKLFLEVTESRGMSNVEAALIHLVLAASLLGEEVDVDVNQFLEDGKDG